MIRSSLRTDSPTVNSTRETAGPDRSRALALRGVTSFLDKLGDDSIPFQRLLTNDDPDNFRGYPDERFRDRGLLLFSGEYRWPAWADKSIDALGVDAVLFVDAGQVFEDAQDIAMASMTYSYGLGLRGAAFGRYLGSLDLRFSEEGFQLVISSRQSFQASSATLFAGSNPVPER